MQQVAVRYGFTPDRSNCIPCPFHADAHPSLRIYDEPGRGFYCFSCGAGGSVVDFVMRLFNINYRQALLRIGSDFGYSDEPTDHDAERRFRQEQAAKRIAERNRQDRINRLCVEHCRLWRTIVCGEDWAKLLIELDFPPPDEWCAALDRIDFIDYEIDSEEVEMCQKLR